ncbi:MAG: 4-hydroxy-3-methylbut-2-enyl diphosphate reductase, partial [Acidimicrobiales bacterium]
VVGVTAGASAPEELVAEVIAFLAPHRGIELVDVTDEDEYFPPPRALRDLINGVSTALSLAFGGIATEFDDRSVDASEVLVALD